MASLGGAYHALTYSKYEHRYLAGIACRFNRRFQLKTLPKRLLAVAAFGRVVAVGSRFLPISIFIHTPSASFISQANQLPKVLFLSGNRAVWILKRRHSGFLTGAVD